MPTFRSLDLILKAEQGDYTLLNSDMKDYKIFEGYKSDSCKNGLVLGETGGREISFVVLGFSI